MTQQLLLDILPGSLPSLEAFITGPNGAAVDAVRTLTAGRALYLWGSAGCGRSHLLRACAHAGKGHYLDAKAPARLLHALATEEDRTLGLVAVDDVELLTDPAQSALFSLFNRWRAAANTPYAFALITAGSRAPLSMALREDLRTRLGWDLVFRLEQLSDAERGEALREQASSRGIVLSDDILRWVLTHYDRDMGRLMTLVDALDQYSLARHRPITLPLLKDLLAHGAPSTAKTRPDDDS